jgi:hypothetical protein
MKGVGYITKSREFEIALERMAESKKNRDIIDIEYYLDLMNIDLTLYILRVLEKIQAYNAEIFRERYGKMK